MKESGKDKMKKILSMSLLKTLIFNLKYFGLKGLKFPVLISKSTKLKKISGKVILKRNKFKSILIGFGPIQSSTVSEKGCWYNTGTIYFDEEAHLYSGFFIYNNGFLKLGKNFRIGESIKKIEVGDDVMISWDCILMDSDLHDIVDFDGKKVNWDKEIFIGNHVWVGFGCSLLKGTVLPNNTIVASSSHISTELKEINCIYGNYGKKIKENVDWKWELTKDNYKL